MTAKPLTCIEIACDVCGEPFTDVEEGGTPHFDTIQDARDYQEAWDADYQWTILDDGYAICSSFADDVEHRDARAALAPAEPVAQVPDQQEIPAVAE